MGPRQLPSQTSDPLFWDTVNNGYPVRQITAETCSSQMLGHVYAPSPVVEHEYRSFNPAPPSASCGRDIDVTKAMYCSRAAAEHGHKLLAEAPRYTRALPSELVHYHHGGDKMLDAVPLNVHCFPTTEMQRAYKCRRISTSLKETKKFERPLTPRFDYELPHPDPPYVSTSDDGFLRHLDPYVTTNRLHHRPFTAEHRNSPSATRDIITYYTMANVPRVRGPWPKKKEEWEPRCRAPVRPMSDKKVFKFDFKEIRQPNKLDWVPGSFVTETRKNYVDPKAWTERMSNKEFQNVLTDWKRFSLPRTDFEQEQILQTYRTETGHIGSGQPLCAVLDQSISKNVFVHKNMNEKLPARVVGRDRVIDSETFKTSSSAYCTKASYNKPNERADTAMNCKNTIFMTGVQKKMDMERIIKAPVRMSETKDVFRARTHPYEPDIRCSPDPTYIFDVVASGRNEAPCIPETATGYRRLTDPYLSTYRLHHHPITLEQYYGIAAKDHITYYTEANYPKVRGFGPRKKEIWMPVTVTAKKGIWDKLSFKLECKPNMSRNPVGWLKGAFKTETKTKYRHPYSLSKLPKEAHSEIFDLPPFQPTPWQTTLAPAMYCSEYCHTSQGTPVNSVVDQLKRNKFNTPRNNETIVCLE